MTKKIHAYKTQWLLKRMWKWVQWTEFPRITNKYQYSSFQIHQDNYNKTSLILPPFKQVFVAFKVSANIILIWYLCINVLTHGSFAKTTFMDSWHAKAILYSDRTIVHASSIYTQRSWGTPEPVMSECTIQLTWTCTCSYTPRSPDVSQILWEVMVRVVVCQRVSTVGVNVRRIGKDQKKGQDEETKRWRHCQIWHVMSASCVA